MYQKYNRRFDVYEYEDFMDFSEKTNRNFNKFINLYKNNSIHEFCDILKVMPFVTDLNSQAFQSKKKIKLFARLNEYIENNASAKELKCWKKYKMKVSHINDLIEEFYLFRKQYFDNHKTHLSLDGELLVVAAELTIHEIANIFNPNVIIANGIDNLENRGNIYEGYIKFISNVVKFFFYEKLPFKLHHKIYSMSDVEIASKHFELNAHWDELMDIIEYFRFSDINIEKENDLFKIEISDEVFDKSVLISNHREKSYIGSMNDESIAALKRENLKFNSIGKQSEYLAINHCKRIFGTENLSNKVYGISIEKWLSSYFFIKEQAIKKLKSRKEIFKIKEVCVVKTFYWWRKQLTKYNKDITIDEADKIIKTFTFDKGSKDLIDNPLIKFDDYLVLIPSITYDLAADRALVSLLANKNIQINFKGKAFEKRLQEKFKLNNIIAENIAAHVNKEKSKENYETDLVFLLDKTLFIVECKSIIPPYTIKDHAKTNGKIIHEIDKFKKNAQFFEKNLNYLKQKLEISKDIDEVIKVFVTSSTLGAAGYFNGIYMIDEAAFNAFLYRNPPVLRDLDMNIISKMSCWEFEGAITAKKLKSFLANPPSLKTMGKTLKRRQTKIGNIIVTRYSKVVPSRFLIHEHEKLKKLSAIEAKKLFEEAISSY